MLRHSAWVFCALITVATVTQGGDTLEEYAQKCDAATGISVPDFSCDDGTVIPTEHHKRKKCDRPNQLHEVCDPGSRFLMQEDKATKAFWVGLCRKKGQGPDNGQYKDIAVIQHNYDNGATCFYQALKEKLDGRVKAPAKGSNAWPWLSPKETAAQACVGCHDNGPIIRSPYLTRLKQIATAGSHQFPTAVRSRVFNNDQLYSFVGSDFASWEAYKVEVKDKVKGKLEDNLCMTCHRMGVSNVAVDGKLLGTGRDFGVRSTARRQTNKNPHSKSSPIWMPPGTVTFDNDNFKAAKAIRACARKFKPGKPLPNLPACKISRFSTIWAPLDGPLLLLME